MSKGSERWTLEVGDLCLFVGNQEIFKHMRRGVIYQVVEKELAPSTSLSKHKYSLRIAFDVENPSGSSTETFPIYGTKAIKKLNLIDLGTLRMHLDDFIRWWATTQGMEEETKGELPSP